MRITESLDTKFELLLNEADFKVWNVRALSVTITGNKREYTREELQLGARSLSFRPLNINHDQSQILPYPQNQTLEMEFDVNEDAVIGRIQVADPTINEMIESGKINKLSIEQVPTKGENCSSTKCTQKGVTFTALALLTKEVQAGDPSTEITKAESVDEETFKCEICDKEYETIEELKAHIEEYHNKNSSDNEELKSKNNMTSTDDSPKEVETKEVPTVEVDEKPVEVQPKEVEDKQDDKLIALTKDQFEEIKGQSAKLIEDFTKALASFKVPEKKESVPSSKVVETPKKESFKAVHEFFDAVKSGVGSGSSQWSINLEDMYSAWGYKSEAVTISSGDRPQVFDTQILVTPDGKTSVPIRQFCNVTSLSGADRAHWYKVGGVSFGAITEGSEPTNESQTLTKITATPTIRGAVQRVGFSQIEDVPALTSAINQAFALEAVSDEEALLHAEFDSVTATNWINANTGADLASGASDDVSGMTFKKEAIIYGLKALATQGYNTSRGNVVCILHPKAFAELLADSNLATYYQQGNANITATGALSELYGVQIVVSPNTIAQNNTTNDTYRNLMFVKGAFGIASARDMAMEAQRRNEVQQVIISGTQRVAVKTLDEKQVVRISSAQ